jgi:hypothetical protein
MKKVLFLFVFINIASLLGILYVTGFTAETLTKENHYSLDDNNISFTLSTIWKEDIDTGHDLSLSKLDSNLHFSVYKKSDVDMTAEELLKDRVKVELEDVDSKILTKKYNVNKTRNRTIYSRLYTVTKNNVETQYLFNVIEFDNSDTYVVAIYTAKGAYMQYSIDDIQRLLIKMEWNGTETELVYN